MGRAARKWGIASAGLPALAYSLPDAVQTTGTVAVAVPGLCYMARNCGTPPLTDTPDQPFFSAAFTAHMQQPLPEFIYHYTSQEGLLGIVASRSLWATNISYMNDATEFDLSFGLLRNRLFEELQNRDMEAIHFAESDPARSVQAKHIEERAHTLWSIANKISGSSVCITCFCEHGDLLSQWRGYSGGGYGYSLAFDTSRLKEIASGTGFLLGRCIYDPDIQKQVIEELVQYVLADPALGKAPGAKDFVTLLKYGAFFKDPSFREEQEWRLVCALPTDIRFRKGKSMIIPYTSLDISAGENLCIQHAVVGPCPHMALSTRSTESLLISNNVIVMIYPSAIPFRDW